MKSFPFMSRMAITLALVLFAVRADAACPCLARHNVCDEVASMNFIFVGTVISVEPAFLNPWDASRLSHLPMDDMQRLREDNSPESIAKMKDILGKLFPDMREHYREEIETARNQDDLRKVFDSITAEGRQAQIVVKTVFKHTDDDDPKDPPATTAATGAKIATPAPKKDDDDDDLEGKVVTVWTDAGDCGFDFQAGETYLIYADDDEETNQLATSSCNRTARLSDAGPDLAYLYYFQHGGDRTTRLEGVVTTDLASRLKVDSDHDAKPDSPSPNAVVRLQGKQGPVYTRSDADGRFLFDGLAEGDYDLTAFAAEYPGTVREIGVSRQFHLPAKSCAWQTLSAPRP